MPENLVGTFEPEPAGGGRLRAPENDYGVQQRDVFVPAALCSSLRLRGGETVVCTTRRRKSGKRRSSDYQVDQVECINGMSVDDHLQSTPFEKLVPIDPDRRVKLETDGGPLSMRVIDLLTPIGFGQRGLIVAPPRTGKTVLLQQIAHGIAVNHPDVYTMVLLIDERPEEVTDMRRNVHGEVIASSNDRDIASHVRIARLMVAKAKRHVECGEDVFMLLDSLTRVGRAFNAAKRGRGRIMSGGLDIDALTEPKAVFGAARNIEHGGSLTIMATALIDTGSRMDEVIFNEFKGTGNMEITLTRELANMRIWPAIDLSASGTRKEERLLSEEALQVSHQIRRRFLEKSSQQAMETLLASMQKYKNNDDFVSNFKASMR